MMEIRTVKVSNVSLGATELDLKDFFSFSGDIEYIEIQGDSERSQVAYVTFKDFKGATIVDQSVTIDLAPDYKLPAAVASALPTATENFSPVGAQPAVHNAEDVVSSMLAKGFILGKDAINKAKAFDEKHQLSSTATATVSSLDQKIGFTDKLSAGTTMVNDKVKQMDERFQVSEKTKIAFSAAEQTVSSAGSAIMQNRYVLTGTSWVTDAFRRAARAATEVGQKTTEKVSAQEEGGRKVEGSDPVQ
nr:binding partner of ACD11 1 isoform X2 [Malus domestica]